MDLQCESTEGVKAESGAGHRRADQIVELAAQGYADKEIAAALQISKHTVDTHWKRLRAKLGVKNRTAAVLECLREQLEQKSRRLLEVNEALRRAHAELDLVYETKRDEMALLLTSYQKRQTQYRSAAEHGSYVERGLCLARAVVYELASVEPVVYRYLSPSATSFGLDIPALLSSTKTFYDVAYPEDVPLLMEQCLGLKYLPDERYLFLYRIKMPEPRWILDTHQGFYNADGSITGILGLAVDVHDLVTAGVISPTVTRVTVRVAP